MKARVTVRIVRFGNNEPCVMFTVTNGGRCSVHTNVTQSSGLRLFQLVERYRTDYSFVRTNGDIQLKFLLEEVK